MAHTIIGKIAEIHQPQICSGKYKKKCTFLLDTGKDTRILLMLFDDTIERLNEFKVGDKVTVEFTVKSYDRGKGWENVCLDADLLDGRHATNFMLSAAGDVSSDAVPWNAQSGVYRNLHSGWQSLIAHFRAPDGSTPSMQLKSTYRNGGLWYRSSRDGFGFEDDWAQIATGNLPFQFWGNNYIDFGPLS